MFLNAKSYLPGGLCEGRSGEFWMADFSYDGTSITDSFYIYKGSYNSNTHDVDWVRHTSIGPNYSKTFDGASRKVSANIAFSPTGSTGWAAFLGDLTGGSDSTYNPVFIKSSDGGATWGAPVEIDLRAISFVGDYPGLKAELQALWVDGGGNPQGSGRPTCAFEFDITVDANGNPHMFVVVANTTNSPSYNLSSGLAKVALDITSDDGGATWKAIKISPILTFRGEFGTPDPTDGSLIVMDNYPQISRTESGSHIFYSWVDSDTAVVGYGERSNLAPNLRIAGLRIADSYQTCPRWVTNGDFIWDGKVLFPTMAPIVLTDNSAAADYKLPIVALEMLTNDQLNPCQMWYFGNDAILFEGDFASPAVLNLDSCNYVAMSQSDTTPPTITLLGADTLRLCVGDTYNEPGFTAQDSIDGDLKDSVVVSGTVNTALAGTYPLMYTVSDAAGNAATPQTRIVIVIFKDTVPPVITLLGGDTVQLCINSAFVEPGFTAQDSIDGDLKDSVKVTGSVNSAVVGNYMLHYNVSDSAGNPAIQKTRLVQVVPKMRATVFSANACMGTPTNIAAFVRDYTLQIREFRFYSGNPSTAGAVQIGASPAARGLARGRVMVTPTSDTTFWVVALGSGQSASCPDTLPIFVRTSNCNVCIMPKAMLEGAYEATTGLIRDDLRSKGLIPLAEPYSAMGYTYENGNPGESITQAVLSQSGNNAIVDWIIVEIRDTTTPATVLASRAALLQADGDIVDTDGVSPLTFTSLPDGKYYVSLLHRNHLGAMAAQTVMLDANGISLDFSDPNFSTYGGANTSRLIQQGTALLYGGDGDRNGQVQNTDNILIWAPEVGTGGYKASDYDLDGQVQNTDMMYIWNHNTGRGSSVPK
jgi:hypothetical protein